MLFEMGVNSLSVASSLHIVQLGCCLNSVEDPSHHVHPAWSLSASWDLLASGWVAL